MLSAPAIFDRYQELRPRFPQVKTPGGTQGRTQEISAITDIADKASAFVFDAFGVLNVGETLIEGADRRLSELRSLGCEVRILTNAASYDRAGALAKFQRLGIAVESNEIITSRDAALDALTPGIWGGIAAPEDQMSDVTQEIIRLGDRAKDYDLVNGFLFLSSSGWTAARQRLLEASLMAGDRPVIIANADLVAPRDNGFSLEPGHFGHRLVDCGCARVRFFGKPFPEVYDLVAQSLPGTPADKIIMCGDTLHTDILGAAARGWRTVLVTRDGLFAGHDASKFCLRSEIHPDWRLTRI